MGNVADFSKYKARKDHGRQLQDKGWVPTWLGEGADRGTAVYIYDDHTRLLLYAGIEQTSLDAIAHSVRRSEGEDLLSLAEQLSALITEFSHHPPFQGDQRLALVAQTAAWFVGFSLSLINSDSLEGESIVILRLVDVESRESAFHLAHLEWPEIMDRRSAESQLSDMARSLRRNLFNDG
ncbi:hypothetical protein [Sedimenticola selenatireducens]|uniref:Uncharacterized protein n=1 Tax=Sedimenticola selenatireducens TaxID=191960 RepID=A0A2N6CYZ3_9GAMM|nr:hypothetical protein [Sedimenticola selenatireducens]PLX62593.1 MAG: hypothetical protein C0630_05105 [Sedimenticola selenatireducens]